MRKEFRVGFGIGGVLLAVFVVALVVHSHTRPKAPDPNKVVAVDNPDAGGGGADGAPAKQIEPFSSTETAPPPATPAPPTPPATPEAIKPTDPFDTWDRVLGDGRMPNPTPTVTPTSGHERGIGNHFSGNGTGGTMTPGNFPPGAVEAFETGGGGAPARTPPARPAGRGSRSHTIAQGETFSTIAKSAYGSSKYYLLIAKANPNVVPERLRPGTTIVLPDLPAGSERAGNRAADRHATGHAGGSSTASLVDPSREYVVKSGDSLYRISVRLYANAGKVDAIYDLNKDRIGPDRQRLKLGMTLKLPEAPTSNAR